MRLIINYGSCRCCGPRRGELAKRSLKQLCLAMHSYESSHRVFPPGQLGFPWNFSAHSPHAQGRRDPAMAALESATTLAPLSAEAQAALADCYVQAGACQAAETIYNHLASSDNLPAALLPELAKGFLHLVVFLGFFAGGILVVAVRATWRSRRRALVRALACFLGPRTLSDC